MVKTSRPFQWVVVLVFLVASFVFLVAEPLSSTTPLWLFKSVGGLFLAAAVFLMVRMTKADGSAVGR